MEQHLLVGSRLARRTARSHREPGALAPWKTDPHRSTCHCVPGVQAKGATPLLAGTFREQALWCS